MSPRAAIQTVSILSIILGSAVCMPAAQLKEAQVTQVVKDVKLLPTGAAARPASVSDEMRDGTAVRTGVDSRSELKFADQTLARLGADTLFSFAEGTRNLNLQDGAMPHGTGTFGVAGTNNPQPLNQAPPIDRPPVNQAFKLFFLDPF